MASARYLAEHLAEVPRSSSRIIPVATTAMAAFACSTRSFRRRGASAWRCVGEGLGTTWVTAALEDEARVKEILGIPAPQPRSCCCRWHGRRASSSVTLPLPAASSSLLRHHVEHGPGETLRFEDRPSAIAGIDIDAPPAVVWSLVADVNVPTRFSKSIGAEWQTDERRVGAVFIGRNRHAAVGSGRWRASSTPATNRPPSAGAPPIPTTRAHGGGSISNRPPAALLRFSYVMGPGPSGTDGDHRQLARRPGSCAAASTRCRPTCSAPSRASAARRNVHDPASASPPCPRARPASSSSARRNGSASTRCGCPVGRRRPDPARLPRRADLHHPARHRDRATRCPPRRCSPCPRCPSRHCPVAGSCSVSGPAARR